MKPLLQWKSGKYYTTWVCVCSLRYPVCNAHAPRGHLWPASFYNIFPHSLINGTIFKIKFIESKTGVLIFILLLSETFLILRRTERNMVTCVYWSSCKVPVILVRFGLNLNFLDSSKNTQIQNFMKIRVVGVQLFHTDRKAERRAGRQTDRRTNRHDETNDHVSQFLERA